MNGIANLSCAVGAANAASRNSHRLIRALEGVTQSDNIGNDSCLRFCRQTPPIRGGVILTRGGRMNNNDDQALEAWGFTDEVVYLKFYTKPSRTKKPEDKIAAVKATLRLYVGTALRTFFKAANLT